MSTKNRRQRTVIALVVVLAMLVTGLGVTARVVHRRNKAEAFLKEATALPLRLATLEQVRQLSARYDGYVDPSTCDLHGCVYLFSFDNGLLHRIRLAPYTWFTCTLGVSDNALVYRRVLLTTGNKGIDFGAFVEEWLSYPTGLQFLKKPFDVRLQPKGVPPDIRWRVHVNMTADATPEQHRIAYGLNLRCLSRIGGCEDAQEILPSVAWSNFRSDGAELVRPLSPSTAGIN